MNIQELPTNVLFGKVLVLIGLIHCAVYPFISTMVYQLTNSFPLGKMGLSDVELLSPYLFLYIITSIGVALGITALLTKDARKAGLIAILAGVLGGNVFNWICLPLMILGGVMCYFGARSGEK